jgi:alkaline phosphatase
MLASGQAGGDADGDGKADLWKLVQTREEFLALMSGSTPQRVCGVARVSKTLQQGRDGDTDAAPFQVPLNDSVPTLAEMSRAAINVLDDDPDGFCLMIEGGAVDWAGHDNQASRMIEEQIDFNRAVEAVVQWVEENSSWADTLLIVTADHETGYLTAPVPKAEGATARPAPDASVRLTNNGKGTLPGMQWNSGQHTNCLVPVYAKGDAARLLTELADRQDPVRGVYIDNAEIGEVLHTVIPDDG